MPPKTSCTLLILMLVGTLHAGSASAQEAPSSSPEEKVAPADDVEVLEGDILTLKSGAVISGHQILRSDPLFFYIEIIQDVEPLQIPRTQVESVEYDTIDPLRDRRRAAALQKVSGESIMAGEKLSPDLMEKLSFVLSEPPIEFSEADLIDVLEELANKVNANINIDASVRSLPRHERMWALKTAPRPTLTSILQDHLVRQFPRLEVDFEFDTILVLAKDGEAARNAPEEAPSRPEPSGPAPRAPRGPGPR